MEAVKEKKLRRSCASFFKDIKEIFFRENVLMVIKNNLPEGQLDSERFV